jgi:thiol-disulfide isomerase/thioredoxin
MGQGKRSNRMRMQGIGIAVVAAAGLSIGVEHTRAQTTPAEIIAQLKTLRSLSATDRPVTTVKLAHAIAALPAGQMKVQLANGLAGLSTEGDQGQATVEAAGEALAAALKETPLAAKGDEVPEPYMELAQLVKYENVKTTLDDPMFSKAMAELADYDADVAKADFALNDLNGKPYTLRDLRGKVVLVNFWATWCSPCRREMPDLDKLQARFAPQGLVILSISDEDQAKVAPFIASSGYRPTVLLDPGDTVHKEFHIEGIPKTYLFDRNGKLVGETIDQCTERQFLELLAKADLR